MTTRAAIYARVSSVAQREAQTIDGQLLALRPFVEQQGWRVVGEFIDDGFTAKTGKIGKRLGYAQLLEAVAAGKVDVLVTAAVDRLTRTEDLIEMAAILGPLQRAAVRIVSPTIGELDLQTEHGRLNLLFQAHCSAVENARRGQRVKAGKERAIRNGTNPAGPVPFGYRYSKDTKQISIVDEEAVIIREIFERAGNGEPCSRIAADFNRRQVPMRRAAGWRATRIYQLIRRSAYRGAWVVDVKRKLTIPTPPIVTPALWHSVNDRPKASVRRGAAVGKKRHDYLIEGLGSCALCGGKIGIASGFRRSANCVAPNRYVCMGRRQPLPGVPRCSLPYIEARELDERVWAAIASLALEPGRMERIAREYQQTATHDDVVWLDDAKDAEKRLGKIETTQAAIVSRFSRGLISETVMDAQLERLQSERISAQHQLDTANRARYSAARNAARGAVLVELTDQIRQRAAETSPDKRRELVRALVKPLGICVSIAEVVLDVRIRRSVAPSVAAAGSREHSDTITIRLVA